MNNSVGSVSRVEGTALASSESNAVAIIISALPSRVANAAEKEKLPVAETGQFQRGWEESCRH